MPVPVAKVPDGGASVPPILYGCYTLNVEERVRRFVLGVPEMLERWITRRASSHTQRAYGQDLDAFIGFMQYSGREESARLLGVTVGQVHAYRDSMRTRGQPARP